MPAQSRRGERSGGNRDENHRRALCQIAGLDEAVPFVDARLADGTRVHTRRSGITRHLHFTVGACPPSFFAQGL